MPAEIQQKLEEIKALRAQRERQQGLGRPIISTQFKDQRVVAVGNRLFTSPKWRTFHDFLLDYIKDVLGQEWGAAEQAKALTERHPIMQWIASIGSAQQEFTKDEVKSASITGAVSAYLGLAYNLYLLAHNVAIQERLIARLKDPGTFWGAYYETFVASVFIKAGFELEFENEDDRTRTHCEFTATRRETKKRYSVEAKSRNFQAGLAHVGQNRIPRLRVWRQVSGALHKLADHTRIVFVDLSSPTAIHVQEILPLLKAGQHELRLSENQKVRGETAPQAYVFLTSDPHHLALNNAGIGRGIVAEGFRMPDFKEGAQFASVGQLVESRDRHADMHHLLESLRTHHEIPATFDGQMPEFAFGEEIPRLLIGHTYLVPTDNGEVPGVLEDAVVLEKERKAWCVFHCPSIDKRVICTNPLTEKEFAAYQRHPETFFGQVKKQWHSNGDPLKLYDFFMFAYKDPNHETLLKQLDGAADLEQLRALPVDELRKIVAERFVNASLHRRARQKGDGPEK
jgi:hypothetical protein